MVARYSLQSTVKGETDPVTLIIHQTADTNEQLELLLAVEGAKHAPHLDHPEVVFPAILRHLGLALERS